jgi:integrase
MAACTPADILVGDGGTRSHHAAISNRKAERGYGRFLTWLQSASPDSLRLPPEARITPDNARAYARALRDLGNGTQTILARLQELGEVAQAIGVDCRGFLPGIAARIRAQHRPVRDKRQLRLSEELLALGQALMDRARDADGVEAAVLHRDGLLIALLALLPLRRRNLAELSIGSGIVRCEAGWRIAIPACQTKTRTPIDLPWPGILAEPLEAWLTVHRPLLCARRGRWARPVEDALWVSSNGSPMTQIAIYDRVRLHTRCAFGAAINPHLFRDAAATTLAIADPARVRVAAAVLGHRSFSTTERHYRQATGLQAHGTFVAVVLKGAS